MPADGDVRNTRLETTHSDTVDTTAGPMIVSSFTQTVAECFCGSCGRWFPRKGIFDVLRWDGFDGCERHSNRTAISEAAPVTGAQAPTGGTGPVNANEGDRRDVRASLAGLFDLRVGDPVPHTSSRLCGRSTHTRSG